MPKNTPIDSDEDFDSKCKNEHSKINAQVVQLVLLCLTCGSE